MALAHLLLLLLAVTSAPAGAGHPTGEGAAPPAPPPRLRSAEARADANAPPESLTVARCVALARSAAPDARAAAGDALAAQLDSAATARNRRPAYRLFGGVLLVPRDHYDPALTDNGSYELKLGASLPLLDGGARRRERAQAALAAASALAALERTGRDAGARAAEVALGLLRQREAVDAARASEDWLARLEDLVAAGVRAGTRERADLERVRIERDAVASDGLAAAEAGEALGRELAPLLGRPGAGWHALAREPVHDAPPVPADSAALLARIASAPEVREARAVAAAARLALDEARRRQALTLDLSADAGLAGTDLTRTVPEDVALQRPGATFSDRLRRDLGASLSLEFSRPLFDPARVPAISARSAAAAAAALRAEQAEQQRRREVQDLLGRWSAAAARARLSAGTLARAEEQLVREQNLYAGGAATLLELLDARRQVDEARARLADARLEVDAARWQGELLR